MISKSMFSKEFLRLKIKYRSDSVEQIQEQLHSTTMKKSGVSLLLGIIFLTLIGVQGTPTMRNGRCSCINTSPGTIHSKSLKDLKQFAPSPSCEKTEIIATMKNGAQTCLNPNSTDVKELIKEWEKQVNQKKKQKKGRKYKKTKKVPKVKKSLHPPQKKTT
ncbi:C-X-C motif chemokine 9 isoform X1 [Orcinus orca]|uniref:C-X-C motif chemokine 9 isoform X1 n=1 Tax=Orcinus orca TaxID=9733 RepID=UPI001441BABF|nr:C-X-C motif chemokine 9 isoform X1 [Orcinus orca]